MRLRTSSQLFNHCLGQYGGEVFFVSQAGKKGIYKWLTGLADYLKVSTLEFLKQAS